MGRKRVDPENRKYMQPEERRQQISDAAFQMAKDNGLGKLTVTGVAQKIGVTPPLIYRYFQGADALVKHVLERGVDEAVDDIVADAIELNLPLPGDTPLPLLQRAKALLAA